MSVARAIHEYWTLHGQLAGLVPPERIFTGLPPLRAADGAPLAFPYVSLTFHEQTQLERTSSGTMLSAQRLRFAVYGRSYEAARRIAAAIAANFNRREFTWSGGRVLDMRAAGRSETEDSGDGVWLIAVDFQVRVAETQSRISA